MTRAQRQPTPDNPSGALRLPLQVGASSLWALGGACLALAACAVLLPLLFIVLRLGMRAWFLWIVPGLGVVVILNTCVRKLRKAHRLRPSDIVLDERGLRVEGGPHDGLSFDWGEIDGARSSADYGLLDAAAEGIPEREARERGTAMLRLKLVTRDGRSFVLAEGDRSSEQESLEALYDSLQGMTEAATEGPHVPPDPRVLVCPGCGAPILPVDADQVSCAYCGHAVAVSLALRSAVRAAGHGADALQRELPSLLERAPAAQLLLRIRLSAALMLGAWPVAFALAAVRIGAALTAAQLLLTILFAWALLLGGFLLAQLLLLDRHALRLLATRFGAARAARPDGPPRCRGCGGPLLVSVNAMLARCVFCSRENLLGVSLRRARSQEAEAESLERALAQQRTKRTRALGLLLGALFLLAVSGAALAQSFDAG